VPEPGTGRRSTSSQHLKDLLVQRSSVAATHTPQYSRQHLSSRDQLAGSRANPHEEIETPTYQEPTTPACQMHVPHCARSSLSGFVTRIASTPCPIPRSLPAPACGPAPRLRNSALGIAKRRPFPVERQRPSTVDRGPTTRHTGGSHHQPAVPETHTARACHPPPYGCQSSSSARTAPRILIDNVVHVYDWR